MSSSGFPIPSSTPSGTAVVPLLLMLVLVLLWGGSVENKRGDWGWTSQGFQLGYSFGKLIVVVCSVLLWLAVHVVGSRVRGSKEEQMDDDDDERRLVAVAAGRARRQRLCEDLPIG
jgi:hypothetical protein